MKTTYTLLSFWAAISLASGHKIAESQQRWIERYSHQTQKVAPENALINTTPEPDLTEGFIALYNGTNLDGWTPRGGFCEFEARGDSIVGIHVADSPSTYLTTDRDDYADFIFTVEVQWEVECNAGIMFRAYKKPREPYESIRGPQCELEQPSRQDRRWSGGIYGQSEGGWRYPLWLEAHEKARTAIKVEGWNRLTIQAIGKDVKTWVNGIPTTHWLDEEFRKGFFGLQVHKGKRGIVHFRNIKIKELEPKHPQ